MNWTEADYALWLARQGRPDNDLPEKGLLGRVRRVALENGWLFYHTYNSRRSDEGFPDVVLAKPAHPLYLWELKSGREKPSLDQQTWLAFLPQATRIEAACYWPRDWAEMEKRIRAH